jgi:hypothetical protein
MGKFSNPPQPEYFVTVTKPNGEMRTYASPTAIPLALGAQEVAVDVNGVSLVREVNVTADQPFELDIAKAFNDSAEAVEEEKSVVPGDSLAVPPVVAPAKAGKGKRVP